MSTVEPPDRPAWMSMSDIELRAALIGRGETPFEAELLVTQLRAGNDLAIVEIGRVLEGGGAGGG